MGAVMVRLRSLALVLVVVVAVATACSSDPTTAGNHDAAGLRWRGTVLDTPQPKPAITLTDTGGQPYDLQARTAGKNSPGPDGVDCRLRTGTSDRLP